MTPKQQYYKKIADTMISNLKKRGFEADYVPDRQAALRAITTYLTKGNTVSCGGSITLDEIGFNTAVKEADCLPGQTAQRSREQHPLHGDYRRRSLHGGQSYKHGYRPEKDTCNHKRS